MNESQCAIAFSTVHGTNQALKKCLGGDGDDDEEEKDGLLSKRWSGDVLLEVTITFLISSPHPRSDELCTNQVSH